MELNEPKTQRAVEQISLWGTGEREREERGERGEERENSNHDNNAEECLSRQEEEELSEETPLRGNENAK